MKKLLSILMLLVAIVTGVSAADETIFLWQYDGSTAYGDGSNNGEFAMTAITGTAKFATYEKKKTSADGTIGYAESVTDTQLKPNITKGCKLGNDGAHIKIQPASGNFRSGDIIYICAYNPILITKVSGTPTKTSDVRNATSLTGSDGLATGSAKASYAVGYITLEADLAEGENIYISRTGGTSVGIAAIKVVRPQSCTDVAAPTSLNCSAQTSSSLTFTWTAATNASKYTATLYSDSECTQEVTSTANITSNTVTFTSLSASYTYYCKVQSNGDGTTYCEEGGVTAAVSGITSAKAYTVTATSNNNEWGTADAEAGSLDEGETTGLTATANEGYKFSNWTVEGTDAELSSTTANPTTLTMGTANATVTAIFRALETYTISYAPGTGTSEISGSKADEAKTEDAAFTLPSTAVFTQPGYLQTGWALTDGGEQAYALGGSYETNAAQTFYPVWTASKTLSFNANGGSGSMEGMIGYGEVKLPKNLFTKSGYTFMGWATSQSDATNGIVSYADEAAYPLNEDATIYAVWAVTDIYLVPATSGDAPASDDDINMQSSSFGGSMKALSANLSYTANGLQFGTDKNTKASVTLDRNLKAGSVIIMKLVSVGTSARGLHLYSADGSKKITTIGWSSTVESGAVKTFSYEVKSTDTDLIGSNSFQLWRNNTVILTNLSIVDAAEPVKVELNNVDGFNYGFAGFCAPKNFSVTNGTAYKAVVTGNKMVLTSLDGIVPANEGVVIAGTKGATATITYTTEEATADVYGNALLGTTERTLTSELKDSAAKFLTLQKSSSKFIQYTGTYFPAYKAYLLLDSNTHSLDLVFDNPTAINGVTETEAKAAPVKVIKNGKLYIGNYNVAGARIK